MGVASPYDGSGDPNDDLSGEEHNIINPGDDPYIAYTIDGVNYWAYCATYDHGSNCSSSITYRLNGVQAYVLLWLLEHNLAPDYDTIGEEITNDLIIEGITKGVPPFELLVKMAEWDEDAESITVSKAFDTLAALGLKGMVQNGNSSVPNVSITFSSGFHDIRPMTPFEKFTTPGGSGIFNGRFDGVVMTVTSLDNSNMSISQYLGEGSDASEILELIQFLTE
jgi:hypothetical protein